MGVLDVEKEGMYALQKTSGRRARMKADLQNRIFKLRKREEMRDIRAVGRFSLKKT